MTLSDMVAGAVIVYAFQQSKDGQNSVSADLSGLELNSIIFFIPLLIKTLKKIYEVRK